MKFGVSFEITVAVINKVTKCYLINIFGVTLHPPKCRMDRIIRDRGSSFVPHNLRTDKNNIFQISPRWTNSLVLSNFLRKENMET
jgi:hypothetical protein